MKNSPIPLAAAAVVVLGVNAVTLALELLATRLLFPDFGNTLYTWSAVISIIIAGFFIGSLAGGYLSDKSGDRAGLVFRELLIAGFLVACVPALKVLLLKVPEGPSVSPPLFLCFLAFGLPAAFLAAVSPAIVALLTDRGLSPSLASGAVSALSAAGSIAGTLITAFYLIPAFGVRGLLVGLGFSLAILAVIFRLFAGGKARVQSLLGLILYAAALSAAASAGAAIPSPLNYRLLFARDSSYQLVRVLEQIEGPELTRVLMLDSTWEGAVKIPSGEPLFEYTRAWRLFSNAWGSGSKARLLFIGGGAYTMPLAAARSMPGAQVDVAEIDSAVEEAGRLYFGLGIPPNVRTFLADGRQTLRGAPERYDGLFVDAYQGVMAIPFHLTTREFFSETSRALKPGGFIALNIIGSVLEREGFVCAMAATLSSVYPWVRVHPVQGLVQGAQNIIVVASKAPGGIPNGEKAFLGTGFEQGLAPDALRCAEKFVLTDDYAPVESLVARYLRH